MREADGYRHASARRGRSGAIRGCDALLAAAREEISPRAKIR